MNISAKFQLHLHYGFWGEDFWIFLAVRLPWQPIKFRGLDKNDMFDRGLLKEYSCKTFVKICSEIAINAFFPHYKSMATLSYHSNQSSYPIGIKNAIIRCPAYRCYMWNLVKIGFMASHVMFENVDRCTDAWLYYKFVSGELIIIYTVHLTW